MRIRSIDGVVRTVRDVDRTLSFYQRALRMSAVRFGEGHTLGDPDGNLIEAAIKVVP